MRGRALPWQAAWGLLVLVWGSSFLFMKVGLHALAPVQIATLRVLSGAAVTYALLRASKGHLPRDRTTWAHLSVFGFFLATVPFTLFALGETRVSSALAGIGNAITPIATVALSLLLVRDERFSALRLLGVVLGFVGVVVIMAPWSMTDRPDLLGFAMTLVAGSSYGVGWTWHRLHLRHRDPGGYTLVAGQLVCASAQLVVVSVVWWLVGSGLPAPWSTHSGEWVVPVLNVLALGVLGTGAAFALQTVVVRAAGATIGTTVTYLIPIVSVLLGVLVLGEQLTAWALLGFAVVLSGAVLVGYGNRWSGALAARRTRA